MLYTKRRKHTTQLTNTTNVSTKRWARLTTVQIFYGIVKIQLIGHPSKTSPLTTPIGQTMAVRDTVEHVSRSNSNKRKCKEPMTNEPSPATKVIHDKKRKLPSHRSNNNSKQSKVQKNAPAWRIFSECYAENFEHSPIFFDVITDLFYRKDKYYTEKSLIVWNCGAVFFQHFNELQSHQRYGFEIWHHNEYENSKERKVLSFKIVRIVTKIQHFSKINFFEFL